MKAPLSSGSRPGQHILGYTEKKTKRRFLAGKEEREKKPIKQTAVSKKKTRGVIKQQPQVNRLNRRGTYGEGGENSKKKKTHEHVCTNFLLVPAEVKVRT